MLKYDFQASLHVSQVLIQNGQHYPLVDSTSTLAVSEAKLLLAQVQAPAPPYEKAIRNVACVDDAHEWQLQPFFNETVCYESSLGQPTGTSSTECMGYETGALMPIDGHFGAPNGTYANSTYAGEVPDGDGLLTAWKYDMPWELAGTLRLNLTGGGVSNISVFKIYSQSNTTFLVAADGHLRVLNVSVDQAAPTLRHATPRHATPRHATPLHARFHAPRKPSQPISAPKFPAPIAPSK